MNKPFIIIVVFIALFSCNDPVKNTEPDKKVCVSDSMSRMIMIDTVKECNIDDELKLSGEVSFDENKVVKVYPISSGQVKEVKVGLGDRVKAGQVLAIIRKSKLDNEASLFKNSISSQREYEEAKKKKKKALAAENKITQQLRINGAGETDAEGNFIVLAPRSGYIL